MLLRIVMLAALVTAFARPVKTGPAKAGSLLIFVIDTSRSMNLIDSGISRFDRAKAAALAALSALKPEDRAALVTADAIVAPTADLQALASRINDLTVSHNAVDPNPVLGSAAALANEDAIRAGRCCVIGDLSEQRWSIALSRMPKIGDNPILSLDLGNGGRNDLTLQNLTISTGGNGELRAFVDLNNTAMASRPSVPLTWSIDQKSRSESRVTVSGASIAKVAMPTVRLPFGRHLVSVAMPSSVPSTVSSVERVITIDPPPRVLALGPAAAVVAAALPGSAVSWTGIDATADLTDIDVLVLCGSASSAPVAVDALPGYLNQGGRVLILPGDGFDLKASEAVLSRLTDRSPPLVQAAATRPFSRLSRGGKSVPADRVLNWKALPDNAHEVAISNGGNALAFSMLAGHGTIMIAATGPGEQWSPLADGPTLRPWLQTLMNDLFPSIREVKPLHTGEPFVTTVPASVDAHSATVTTPDGKVDGIVVRRFTQRCEMRYPQTSAPGVYRLFYRSIGRPRTLYFSVAPDAPALPPALAKSQSAQVIPLKSAEDLPQLLAAQTGIVLDGFWPSVALAVIAFAATLLLESERRLP